MSSNSKAVVDVIHAETDNNGAINSAIKVTEQWFEQNNWTVFDFQEQAWQAWHRGESGLIHSPTGSGKTLAAWLGPVQAALDEIASEVEGKTAAGKAQFKTAPVAAKATDIKTSPKTSLKEKGATAKKAAAKKAVRRSGLQVLWITPLRALANDTCEQLQSAADALNAEIRVEVRTGDTSGSRRAKQLGDPPYALITTPESLSVMLSYANADKTLRSVHTVIVDEWHELLGSKRGVQLQLCLARLRLYNPQLRVWGVSATLANIEQAMTTLLGPGHQGRLIRGVMPKSVEVESVLPQTNQHFRWSGHLGVQLVESVAGVIAGARSSLVFTNTRSQAELWYQALLEHKPEWLCTMALHHGSLDRKLRQRIEEKLRAGELTCVVCTSSLDLGVDFSPVDQVLQIGSPKGVGRLLQRAGRSGHQPGAVSRVVCVPTHAFELVEIAAVRQALVARRIEPRDSPERCLDVLCQHLVTLAMGGGFKATDALEEIKSTFAFSKLSAAEWQWVLDFITRGGQALQGYPQYHKVLDVHGTYKVIDRTIAQRHRMSIGTITSDAQITVAFQRGKRLGSTEESFITRLKPGDTFQFAGRHLELLRVRDMTATVKAAGKRSNAVPRWWGTHMPISTELADTVLDTLHEWRRGNADTPELAAVDSMLQLQQQWSLLPGPDDFLIEVVKTREGHSLFCFPFAGRLAHEGLAMLIAQRLSELQAITLTLQVNDYGFELQCPQPFEVDTDLLRPLFSTDNLLEDILASVNSGEIAKRQFRNIARIAGLVFNGYPGKSKTAKQVQASSGLIFDVFENYDKDNLLLDQAKREVLEQQLEFRRLADCLNTVKRRQWHLCYPPRLTPLSFPLWAESVQSQTFSSESFETRVNRMLGSLEKAAVKTLGARATVSSAREGGADKSGTKEGKAKVGEDKANVS